MAIGVAGLEPLADYRGQYDPYGYELHASVIAVADEVDLLRDQEVLVVRAAIDDNGAARRRRVDRGLDRMPRSDGRDAPFRS